MNLHGLEHLKAHTTMKTPQWVSNTPQSMSLLLFRRRRRLLQHKHAKRRALDDWIYVVAREKISALRGSHLNHLCRVCLYIYIYIYMSVLHSEHREVGGGAQDVATQRAGNASPCAPLVSGSESDAGIRCVRCEDSFSCVCVCVSAKSVHSHESLL